MSRNEWVSLSNYIKEIDCTIEDLVSHNKKSQWGTIWEAVSLQMS